MNSRMNRNGHLTAAVDLTHLDGRHERALIGSLMLDREHWPLVAALLTPESFREPDCGLAWQLARRARVRIEAMECPSPATKHALAEAAEKIHRLPLILDQSSRALEAVVSSIRQMRRRHGVEMVVVDCIGLVRPPDVRAPREQQIAVIARRLKELAVEQQIAVLACAQLNRGLDSRVSKVPQLSDLRESGAIEQDADIVLFVHRPGKDDSEVPDDVSQIIVAKQRQGGTGRVDLGWRGALTTFTERPGPFGD